MKEIDLLLELKKGNVDIYKWFGYFMDELKSRDWLIVVATTFSVVFFVLIVIHLLTS